jgi:hypothetical protein
MPNRRLILNIGKLPTTSNALYLKFFYRPLIVINLHLLSLMMANICLLLLLVAFASAKSPPVFNYSYHVAFV